MIIRTVTILSSYGHFVNLIFHCNFIPGKSLFEEDREFVKLNKELKFNIQQLIAARVLHAETASELGHAKLEISKLSSQLNLYHSLESKQYGGDEIIVEENPLFTVRKNEFKTSGSEKMKKLERESKDSVDADVTNFLPRAR